VVCQRFTWYIVSLTCKGSCCDAWLWLLLTHTLTHSTPTPSLPHLLTHSLTLHSLTHLTPREKLQERLAKLSGGVAVLKIGGASEVGFINFLHLSTCTCGPLAEAPHVKQIINTCMPGEQ
jgi:hypothetical protein